MVRQQLTHATRLDRRGNTLIVVLSLLSLFAVVGITFVYFTSDQKNRAATQAQSRGLDTTYGDSGMGAFNAYLATFIYDDFDTGQGLMNALRGHSLMATMYSRMTGATTAFDGLGAFGATNEFVTVNGEPQFPRILLTNHRVFPAPPGPLPNWFDPEWANPRPGGSPGPGQPGQSFIPKNAPYTYPDLNNFFLASIDPRTGEILTPSYHRAYAFRDGSQPAGATGLEPTNPKWNQGTGAVQTPRPGRLLNPNFPLVPPNADNTWTGDVRNRPGGYVYDGAGHYFARNDSIWIDIGLPARTINGRRVKPLVAALVIDLDSYLNLNVHGNLLGAGGIHTSGQGWGKWEVSLERLLNVNNEGRTIVANRGTNQTRGGVGSRAPAYGPLPSYAPVAWAGGGGAAPNSLNLPGVNTGPLFANDPAYSAGFDSTNAAVAGHPSLRNPNEWGAPTAGLPRTFSLTDAFLFHSRHAGPPGFYALMDVGAAAPTTLRGTFPGPTPNPPTQTTFNPNRTDPAHMNRGSVTPYSAALDRIMMTPGSTQPKALNAALGGVDMNRRLADYRTDPTQPISPTNLAAANVTVGTQVVRQAEADRQAFARDIFARLIVATNVAATDATVDANGNVTILALPAAPGYAILRNLAQIAVNMVDYRDEDNISTAFVWNPLLPVAPATTPDPFNPANFAAAELGNRVVFGVEKSRLVIHEAYAEHVNDASENGAPTKPSQIRFWVELMNPGGGATGQDDGGAQLRYPTSFNPYRLEIARFSRPNAAMTEDLGSYLANPANVTGSFDPTYQPEIQFLFNDATFTTATPRVMPNAATYADATGALTQGFALVAPKRGAMAKTPEFDPLLPDPTTMMPTPPWDKAIVADAEPAAGNGQNAMAYQTGAVPQAADVNRADFKRHVVLLRRLANPHLPEGPTNPYVTVDYMDYVSAFDAVTRLMGDTTDRTPTLPVGSRYSIGKVQPQAGQSLGVMAAGANDPTHTFPSSMVIDQNPTNPIANQPKHTFGRHNGQGAAPAATTFTAPATLTDTTMVPFEWLVHLDRPLINQIELIHVTGGKPHELTQNFIVPNGVGPAATGIVKHNNALYNGTATSPLFTSPQSYYRALELLRTQSRSEGEAFGGRVQGLINLNTLNDKRVWDSIFDAQVANNVFTQAQVDQMWLNLIRSRTLSLQQKYGTTGQPLADTLNQPYQTPVPGATVYDTDSTTGDRPFLPLGVSTVPPGPAGTGGSTLPGGTHVFGGGTGIDDTILRRINLSTGLIDPTVLPTIFQNTGMHPYQQAEAARKIMTNTTTVSNTFAVWVTVGYFEVVSEVDSPVQLPTGDFAKFVTLGDEVSREVRGDLRSKFFAIVNRANVGLEPVSYQTFLATGTPPVHATYRPFFTTVEPFSPTQPTTPAGATSLIITAPGGQVYSDGVAVNITPGNPGQTLVIGVGATREFVRVGTVTPQANGQSLITLVDAGGLPAPLTKDHPPGECVSNVVPGNPGPQPGFDVNGAAYQPVVPYWSRVP